jgi:hypothetical protein
MNDVIYRNGCTLKPLFFYLLIEECSLVFFCLINNRLVVNIIVDFVFYGVDRVGAISYAFNCR